MSLTKNVPRLLYTVFFIYLAQSLAGVLIPIDASSIGLGASAIGLLLALPQAVGFVTDIPFAGWSDIVGRKLPILLGSVAGLSAAMILAGSTSSVVLALGALIFGLSISLSNGPTLAFLSESAVPQHHAKIQGFNGSIQGLSVLVGATAAGFLISAIGARRSFWAMALVMACVGAIVYALRESTRKSDTLHRRRRGLAARYLRALQLIRTERAVRMAGSVSLLYVLQLLTLENSFVPLYLISDRHYSGSLVGLLLATRSLVGVALSAVYGKIFARFGLVRPILLGNSLGLVGIIVVGLVADPAALIVPFALQGTGIAFGPATANLLITSVTTENERAIGFSANSLMTRLGGLLFPAIVGFAVAAGGYRWLFICAAGLGGLGLVALSFTANSLGLWQEHRGALAELER